MRPLMPSKRKCLIGEKGFRQWSSEHLFNVWYSKYPMFHCIKYNLLPYDILPVYACNVSSLIFRLERFFRGWACGVLGSGLNTVLQAYQEILRLCDLFIYTYIYIYIYIYNVYVADVISIYAILHVDYYTASALTSGLLQHKHYVL